MSNKLNAFMDHVWDGFYTGQVRMSRFNSVVNAPNDAVYDLVFSGTPPKKMRFTMNSMAHSAGMTIRIAYPSAESRKIYLDNEGEVGDLVISNDWDDKIMNYAEIKQDYCGENRYLGVLNILEFYLENGCTL